MIKINDDINIYFPLKHKPRKVQYELLYDTIKSISHGHKFILLNASTGIGKSYFAVMFMNWYKNIIGKDTDTKFDIVTDSKILQDQYKKEFPFIKVLKGKSNYTCDKFDTDCEKGLQLCTSLNQRCNKCPYKEAKEIYKNSDVSLVNFHLFDSLQLFTNINDERKTNVLIIDEAHNFESIFANYISLEISARMLKSYGFEESKIREYDILITNIYQKIQRNQYKISDFIMWLANEFTATLQSLMKNFTDELNSNLSKQRLGNISSYIKMIETKLLSIKQIQKMYEKDENNWVFEISKNEKEKSYSGYKIDLKPIWVNNMLKELWKQYDHIIFMSGTILNNDMFSYINGLEPELTSYYSYDSPFEIKNRMIYYLKGVGRMVFKEKKTSFKKQKVYIEKILKKYENDKGIIHTFNYELAGWIQNEIFDKRLLFHTTKNREEILNKHMSSKEPTVLVSPSMHVGIDLKRQLSHFQIIAKMPYPNISSEKIKARQKSNKEWYNFTLCSSLIQAYGRSVRDELDFADTYILDDSFSSVIANNSKYLPRWFTDAIKTLKID